jgi:hypothetical protein
MFLATGVYKSSCLKLEQKFDVISTSVCNRTTLIQPLLFTYQSRLIVVHPVLTEALATEGGRCKNFIECGRNVSVETLLILYEV